MTGRQTTFLLAVAEERSLSRAGARLGVERDEIVGELRRLEAQLGVLVLERTPGGLRLTAAGRDHLVAEVARQRGDAKPARATPAERLPTSPPPSPVLRELADPPTRSTRRAVLLGAGALGLAGAVAAASRFDLHGRRPSLTDVAGEGEVAGAAGAGAGASEASRFISEENARPGSPQWVLADGDRVPRPVEGFADTTSATIGTPVTLYVQSDSPTFVVEAYRLGWYGGTKARLIWTSGELAGGSQPAPEIDSATNMVDCSHWEPSTTFTPDATWPHGQYLLKLVQPDGRGSYIPFVLRSSAARSEVLVIAAVSTGAAYETWGGHSLYEGAGEGVAGRATVVSLDRPMGTGYGGAGWLLGGSSEIAQLLESEGVDVAYATSVDQHADPAGMQRANLVISTSHDEYYSPAMRVGLQQAVDNGVNVMFLGANAIYRKIRFEESPIGPNRRIVNYRSAAADPESDPSLVTTNWREGPAPLAESSLTANWYESNEPGLTADMRVVDAGAWMFAGTGLASGGAIAEGVREEFDRVRPGKPLPEQLQILAHSPLTVHGKQSAADMTYATHSSGAAVFNAGTLRFQQRLGPLSPPGQGGDDGALRRLVWNLVEAFRTGPAGRAHPARRNVEDIYPAGSPIGDEVPASDD